MNIQTKTDRPRRARPTPSMIVSLVALVIATSTGAHAAGTIAAKNSVVSKSIKDKNVKTQDLAAGAVGAGKLKDGSVNGAKIVDGSVSTGDIGDGQIGLNDISTAARNDLSRGGPAYSTHFETGGPVPTSMTVMASLNLPAGNYVLSSKAQIDTFNNGDIVECDLVAGALKDQSFVQGGSVHQSQIISNSLVATLVTGGTAALQCKTYGGGGIGQVRLTAITVGSVTNQ